MGNSCKKYSYLILLIMCYLLYIFGINKSTEISENEKNESAVDVSSESENILVYEEKKKVALTFDDGPGESTKKLLDGLKERNVRATFFVTGSNAEKYPELIKRMSDEGHIVGNHTYSHCQLTCLSCANALDEIEKTNSIIETITGIRPTYLRPPFGECTKSVKNETNMFSILWDVDPLDWKVQNTETVIKNITEKVQEGDIILLHDIFETSVDAALAVIDTLSMENYEFITVDELLFP